MKDGRCGVAMVSLLREASRLPKRRAAFQPLLTACGAPPSSRRGEGGALRLGLSPRRAFREIRLSKNGLFAGKNIRQTDAI
jgi:hypothetical protein